MENIKEKTNIVGSLSFDKTEKEKITNSITKTKLGEENSKEEAKTKTENEKKEEKKETKTKKRKNRKKIIIKLEGEKTDEKGIIDEKPELKEKEMENNQSHEKNKNAKSFLCIKAEHIRKIKKYKIPIILIISIILILTVLIIVILHFLKKKKDKIIFEDINDVIQGGIEENINKTRIKKEFDIITKPGDLKYVSLVQKTKEETKIDNKIITTEIIRKTNYDIYFISESDPDEKNKLYYSKMYTAVVSIRSECASSNNKDCQPYSLIDLTQKPNYNNNNVRNLEKSEDFKDVPIALCLFNITDNHIITTVTCPESFSESKKNEIILDMYFFRTPAAERIDKENNNITLNIIEDKEAKRKIIHETNGGLCNIYNSLGSKCTTEMNTTLDQEGNLLAYDEIADTIINYDEKNSFKKNKITNLIDISEKLKEEDVENYQKALDTLLPLMKPHMKEEILFTQKEFNDFYNLIQDKSKPPENQSYQPKKTKNTFRNLNTGTKTDYILNTTLFSNNSMGLSFNLDLNINPGLNSQVMGAYGSIIFDDHAFRYASIEVPSSVQDIIDKLSCLSKAGNLLATELYNKINDKLEGISNAIFLQFKSLNDFLKYYDINEIFNYTLTSYSFNKLPYQIIQISNELLNKLNNIYTSINSGNINNYVQSLSEAIYRFLNKSHDKIKIMLNNLNTLSNTLLTKNNTFTEITNYYLNNTSSSYVGIIKNIENILQKYFIDEYNIIFPKVKSLLYFSEKNSNNSLKNELFYIKDLYNKIKERIYTINFAGNEQHNLVLSNLKNSEQYPLDIINKLKNYTIEKLNIKSNGYFISNEEIQNFNNSFISIISNASKIAQKLDNVNIIDKNFDNIMIKFRENFIETIKFMEEIKSANFTLEEDILNDTLFNQSVKRQMEDDIKFLCDEMLNKLKNENDIYLGKINNYFNKFFEDNLDDLNNIISDLNIIFSEEALKEIVNSFKESMEKSLVLLKNQIINNINLAKEYFVIYNNIINNKALLKLKVQGYYLDYEIIKKKGYSYSRTHQNITYDEITGQSFTSAYLSKFSKFLSNLDYTQFYLSNKLISNISDEYKKIFTEIKNELHSIINNKLTEKFPDFDEIILLGNHIKTISKLNGRLYKYFSNNSFNEKFLPIIKENINNDLDLVRQARKFIYSVNSNLTNFSYFKDDLNDICVLFKRKVCYGCPNCINQDSFNAIYCFTLTPYENNHINLTKITHQSLLNTGNLSIRLNDFYNRINPKIKRYNNILNNFELNISNMKEETLNENIVYNYLNPINNLVNIILNQKYKNVILEASYDYYEKLKSCF